MDIHTRLHGTESSDVAADMSALADVLDFFNNVDDDEAPRLYKHAIAIYRRVEGSSSENVARTETWLGTAHLTRAGRARTANDLDRFITNLELGLPHLREAARIFRHINCIDKSDGILLLATRAEEDIRMYRITRAAAATRG